MGGEPAGGRLFPLALAAVLGVGCTTRVINLAAREGGADDAPLGRAVADVARPADVADAISDGDTSLAPDGSDGAAAAAFERAYDAGATTEPAHYVQFTCCTMEDARTCTDAWMGGADTCQDAAQWKQRAYTHCESLAASLTDYWLYGACVPTGAF